MNGGIIGAVNLPSNNSASGVWSIQEANLAEQQGIWPAALILDPYWEYVRLLLSNKTASTLGSQNNTFLDSSPNNLVITRSGNTTQGSFNPYGGNWSNYFDGTGDYMTVPSSATSTFNPSSGFTIEAWVYPTLNPSFQFILSSVQGTGAFESYWFIGTTSGGNWRVSYGNASASDTGVAVVLNTWHHVALSCSSSNARFFLNGNQVASVSVTQQNINMNILMGKYAGGSSYYFNGYISNVRYVQGQLYTSSFTPSSLPLTAIANTSLLTCQSNRFIDNSLNNYEITAYGDTRIDTFSPFDLINQGSINPYNITVFGGSAYFDGSGDYLTATLNAAIGTGNFTFETWVYFTGSLSGTTNNSIFTINGSNDLYVQFYQTNLRVWISGLSTSYLEVVGMKRYVWYHIAVSRSGTTVRLFLNGTIQDTDTTSGNITATNVFIGSLSASTGWWTGNISGLRLLIGSALYTSNFTPPSSPPTDISNTKLLMNFTNSGIIDSSTNTAIETVGNSQVSTLVKKYGVGSLLFDGTGDYLNVLTIGVIGKVNFTCEGWFYHTSAGQAAIWWDTATSGYGDTNFSIRTDYIGSGAIYCFVGGVSITFSYTNAVTFLNNWVHVALVRSENTLKLYLNGIAASETGTLNSTSINLTNFKIAGAPAPAAGYSNFTGYISDFRFTRGYARYTTNFTPPTESLPIV